MHFLLTSRFANINKKCLRNALHRMGIPNGPIIICHCHCRVNAKFCVLNQSKFSKQNLMQVNGKRVYFILLKPHFENHLLRPSKEFEIELTFDMIVSLILAISNVLDVAVSKKQKFQGTIPTFSKHINYAKIFAKKSKENRTED